MIVRRYVIPLTVTQLLQTYDIKLVIRVNLKITIMKLYAILQTVTQLLKTHDIKLVMIVNLKIIIIQKYAIFLTVTDVLTQNTKPVGLVNLEIINIKTFYSSYI
jgi:hypothetical protein